MNDIGSLSQCFFAQRIGGKNFGVSNQIYKFEKIKIAKRESLERYPNRLLIDMGIGEPDGMASETTINILCQEATKYENRGYADNGCFEFKQAVATYMSREFNVALDPSSEIMHSMGSKSALSILPLCFIDPGDVVITTTPGYPIFGTHAKYLMADVIGLPLLAKNNFLPDFTSLSEYILERTKAVIVNYPNNPTGACATKEFFQNLVELAHKYQFVIINDAAYSGLTFDSHDKLSILNIDGAMDVALELHSLSKGFNMTGWRIGWVCGNKDLIDAYGCVKGNTDSGQFLAIQKAAAITLLNQQFFAENNARKYSSRMEKIIPILRNCGFTVNYPKAGFFLYTKSPTTVEHNGHEINFTYAESFAQWMITELGIVVVPWDDSEPAIRLSMTFGNKDIDDDGLINVFRERMETVKFIFKKSI